MSRPTMLDNVEGVILNTRAIVEAIRREARGRTCGGCSHFNGACGLDWNAVSGGRYHDMRPPLIITPEAVACNQFGRKAK